MSGADFTAGIPAAGHFEEMVAIARAHDGAEVADGRGVRGFFKRIDHLKRAEPAEVATVVADAGVIGPGLGEGNGFEIFAVGDALTHGLCALVGFEGVGRLGLYAARDQDVARTYLLLLAFPCLAHEFIEQIVVGEVGASQLGAVAGEFLLKGLHGVHAERLCGLDLEFEVDEQLHVFVQCGLGDDAVAVVFEENVLKIGERNGILSNGKDGFFLRGCRGCGQEGSENHAGSACCCVQQVFHLQDGLNANCNSVLHA